MNTLRKIAAWTLLGLGVTLSALVTWYMIPIEPTMAPLAPRPDTQHWTMSKEYGITYSHSPAAPPSEKPPIVFLHGGPGGYVHSSIIALLSGLSQCGFDVYFYDQVGCGLSDRLERPRDYTFLGHVADLREIIVRHLRAERAILIGHSYGGSSPRNSPRRSPNWSTGSFSVLPAPWSHRSGKTGTG